MEEKIKELKKSIEDGLIKKYKLQAKDTFITLNLKKEMINCQLLIEEMETLGAPEEDLMRILSYMIVVMNAEKNRLNWYRAYEDFDINELVEKYLVAHIN